MRRFSWVLTIPVLIVIVAFAVANRTPVAFDLWPFELSAELPLFVVVLGSVFAGLVIGGVAAWLSGAESRRRGRRARHRATELQRELDRLRREREMAAAPPTPRPSGQAHPPAPAAPPAVSDKLPAARA